ncbi:hypothetical protein TNCV_1809521 [Trichonephila clavipes]|nr:hypothetical protein TNCV_1809521 [Trichonephila clavipes]
MTWTTPELAPPSPSYNTKGRKFQLSIDLTCIAALHGGLPIPLGYRGLFRVAERCTLNLSRTQTSSLWCGEGDASSGVVLVT